MTRHSLCMIPPLFAFHVINTRGGAPATPWYLAGGVSAANCIAAYQPIGAASLAASYANIANSGTYDAELGAEPDWDSTNGWKGTADGYLKTNDFMPNPTGETWSFIIRASNLYYTSNNAIFGAYNGTTNRFGSICLTTGLRVENGGQAYIDTSKPASGVFALTNEKYYRDGSYVADAAGTPYNTDEISIMARHSLGVFNNLITLAYVQAIAIYNVYITADQVAAITTAMNALTSESRSQSLEGLLDFEPEEEKLWWEGADLVEAAAQVVEAPEQTWWQKANNVVSDALGKAKSWIDSKLYQLWQAIEDYFDYDEEE